MRYINADKKIAELEDELYDIRTKKKYWYSYNASPPMTETLIKYTQMELAKLQLIHFLERTKGEEISENDN